MDHAENSRGTFLLKRDTLERNPIASRGIAKLRCTEMRSHTSLSRICSHSLSAGLPGLLYQSVVVSRVYFEGLARGIVSVATFEP